MFAFMKSAFSYEQIRKLKRITATKFPTVILRKVYYSIYMNISIHIF